MINVITQFGSSFKGLASYLYHDVDQDDTSDRVAWTHTHNLATDDPERAWRIMAATAMTQAELKAEAGIKNTGRKSHKSVLHYVLSWSPDEYGEYSKEEMIDAAVASMTYLGAREGEKIGKKRVAKRTQYANEHQAVIVCHDEGPGKNPHIHIMLNRVHPDHGVMVSDSKDYEKLSAWSLDYRRSQDKEHLCPQRVKNAAKKAQGLLTSHPRKPRNVYEQDQAIKDADPGSRKKALLDQQQRRAKELKAKSVKLKKQQTEAIHKLEDRHLQAEKKERAKSVEAIRAGKAKVKAAYATKIDGLTERQADEMKAFNEAKDTVAGRVRNTWAAFKTREWMTEIRTQKLHAVTGAFKLAFSSGMQRQQLETYHKKEQRQLHGDRNRAESQAAREIRMDEGFKLDDLRQKFYEQRNDLLLEYGMDKAKLKAEWHQLGQDRYAVATEDERARKAKAVTEQSPDTGRWQAAKRQTQAPPIRSDSQNVAQPPQQSDDPLIDDRAMRIEAFKQKMRDRHAEKQRQRDRDRHDRDR